MIKPSDLTPIPQGNPMAQAEIERLIDETIRQHHNAGMPWPVIVPILRGGWSPLDIDAVLERYHAAGWQVTPGGRDSLASLQPAQP